ncbi:uncharacterized protein [Antedon mediterranea]|uniref:uncharacterized protein n=1 Tax=Antedon mediterranea TaxID=105859 RepID=UPI003AF9831A
MAVASTNYKNTHLLTIEPDTYWSRRTTSDPVDVEFDIEGNILVCNATDEIIKFNQQGQFLSRFSVGLDRKIKGMSCNENGEIFMTDDNAKEVIVCDDEGQVTFDFSVPRDAESSMNLRGLVVSNETGDVYVVDSYAAKVLRLTKNGKLLNKLGIYNEIKGTLVSPCYIALDSNQNVLVNDKDQNRVQVFRPDGQFVRSLRGCRHPGTSLEFLNQASGIAVLANGTVAVGSQAGLFVCKNESYGPIIRRFDDKNSSNGIMGTKGIATYRNVMAVALSIQNAESTIELFVGY